MRTGALTRRSGALRSARTAATSSVARTSPTSSTGSIQIGTVVKLITGFAAQTNLLALHTTIEAARAGDAGCGFAVIANEVKEFANEKARATQEVATQISAVRDQTGEAVRSIGKIDATVTALAATQRAVDALVHA